MGVWNLLRRVLGQQPSGTSVNGAVAKAMHVPTAVRTHDPAELARRLGLTIDELTQFDPQYHAFSIPKRRGGVRVINAPSAELKMLQRRILRRLLGGLACHAAARGFEKGQSIVTNAQPHCGAKVLLKMDIREFFPATSAERVREYFGRIGWDKQAADLLTRLCIHRGGLPQGAPTSPRLSNLVNHGMDARLAGLAARLGCQYTRYADDLTFSLPADNRDVIAALIRITKRVCEELGYRLHQDRKLQIRRRYERQQVTGLVVNDAVNLPRATRRWLRAVEHHIATGKQTTLTADQLLGWQSLRQMVQEQRPQTSPEA